MEIEVRLFAMLRDYLPDGTEGFAFRKRIDDGSTIGRLKEDLGIPRDMPTIVVAKGAQVDEGYIIRDGDVISMFPPLGGG